MKRAKLTIGIICGLVVASVLGGIVVSHVSAQASNANAAQGIEISPALVELNAARGKTYNINLKVTNVTASDLEYDYSVNDFNSAGESGSPHVILDSKLPATASVITWISPVSQFTLQARKSKSITVQIVIPTNAEPGGHYGVLRFSGKAPKLEETGVGLSVSAGVLLLIRVNGAISEKATLASFYSSQNGKQSSVFENSPITFVTRIKNEGNIHVKPVGSIELHDMFGNLVKTLPVGDINSNVLPSSIRRYEAQYDNKWMIGRYTANLALGYGTTGQAITGTISFWVIPYKIILACLVILATVIYILVRLVKVYNRHIINKAKNDSKNKKHSRKKS
jgi:hypothetical protein